MKINLQFGNFDLVCFKDDLGIHWLCDGELYKDLWALLDAKPALNKFFELLNGAELSLID